MISKSIKLFFVLILFGTTSLHSLIIVTHGFPRNNPNTQDLGIYEPQGHIYEILRKQAIYHGHDIQFFEWNPLKYLGLKTKNYKNIGQELALEIIKEAKQLYTGRNKNIILIGIGYGGLICYHASQFLAKQIRTPDVLKKLLGLSLSDRIPRINKIFIFGMPYVLDAQIKDHPNYDAVDAIYNITSFTDKQMLNQAMQTALVPPCFYPGLEKFMCINVQPANNHALEKPIPTPSIAEHIFDIAEWAEKNPPHSDHTPCTCTKPHIPLNCTLPE